MSKTIVVTGASGGIGGAIVRRFAQQGHRVVAACNTNLNAAQALCSKLAQQGCELAAISADVSSEMEVEKLFAKTKELYGDVEILVNNAGITSQSLFCDVEEEEWDDIMNVNAKGTFLCCKAVLPYMLKNKCGNIVNVSSMWGQVGGACEVAYSAAKAAVIGLTKALAKEVALSGVRVNCVAPGIINTAMLEGFSSKDKEMFAQDVPMGRMGTAEEVANVVCFIASSEASYLTGQVIAPNGGIVV